MVSDPKALTLRPKREERLLAEGAATALYESALRDGTACLVRRQTGPGGALLVAHEVELAGRLSCPALLKPLGQSPGSQGWAAFEDPGARPLRINAGSTHFDVGAFLRVALAIGRAVEALHGAGAIHGSLSPAAVLLAADDRRAWLTGLVPTRGAGRQPWHDAAWMAPEQTGRLAWEVDERTDLYALGLLFFTQLAGTHPFPGGDDAELAHHHLTRRPPELTRVVPQAPSPLAQLVARLLEKSPDERYQTARGLRADLARALDRWEASASLAGLRLGLADVPARLRAPKQIVGRRAATQTLSAAYERARAGGAEWVTITGPAGIGKSALVAALALAEQGRAGARVAWGKCDQIRRDIPFAALAQAFEVPLRSLLALPAPRLAALRLELRQSLGPGAGALAEILPELGVLLDHLPPVPELAPAEAQQRIHTLFARLVAYLSGPGRPLVLALDDVQWADAATLTLLAALLTPPDVRHVLAIGAWRAEEVGPEHPLAETLAYLTAKGVVSTSITLSALSSAEVTQLVAAMLYAGESEVGPLARLVEQKTAGNPFFVITFLQRLREIGVLTYDEEQCRWRWDVSRVAGASVTDNVVTLVEARLNHLPSSAQRVLSVASCVGTRFPVSLVAQVVGTGVEHALEIAANQGLVTPANRSETGFGGRWFAFAHDRIQLAAHRLLDAELKAGTHLELAKAVRAGITDPVHDERTFRAVYHASRAPARVRALDERLEWARLHLIAGQRALASQAHESAAHTLRGGVELLLDAGWDEDYALALELHVAGAQAEYLASQPERADTLVRAVATHARTPLDHARILLVQVARHANAVEMKEAIACGLHVLRLLGVEIADPPDPARDAARLGALIARLEELGDEGLAALPTVEDDELGAVLRCLEVIGPATAMTRPDLLVTLLTTGLNMMLERGLTGAGSTLFSAAALPIAMSGATDVAYRVCRFGLEQARRAADPQASGAHVHFSVFVQHFKEHLSAAPPLLREGARLAYEVGNLEHMGYNVNQEYVFSTLLQDDLAGLDARCDSVRERLERHGQVLACHGMLPSGQLVANLRGVAVERVSRLKGARYDAEPMAAAHEAAGWQMGAFLVRSTQCWLAVLWQDWDEACRLAELAEPFERASATHFAVMKLYFHRALARLRRDGADASASATEDRDRLAVFAEGGGASNYAHLVAMLDAELARLGTDPAATEVAFDLAVQMARDSGFRGDAALAHELAASWHTEQGRDVVARAYLREGRYLYDAWGAVTKVHAISEGLGEEAPPSAQAAQLSVDAKALLDASRAISQEASLDGRIRRLLTTLVEVAGASRAALFMVDEDGLRAVAEYSGGRAAELLAGTPLDGFDGAPRSVVRFVARTAEVVSLDDAAARGPFIDDPYVRETSARSILCAPLVSRGRVGGVVCLENRHVAGAFAPSQVELARMISLIAATSVENARLYGQLAEHSSELEAIVSRRTAELQRLFSEHALVLSSLNEGVCRVDTEGHVTWMNPAAERETGFTSRELQGGLFEDVLHVSGPDAPRLLGADAVQRSLARFRKRNGTTFEVECSSHPVVDEAGQGLGAVLTFHSMEGRRALEEQLRYAQRVKSMGQLAGGIAHDFNNLLTPIMGNIELTLDRLGSDQLSRRLLRQALQASDRAAELVRQMLALGQRSQVIMKSTDVGPIVRAVPELVRSTVGSVFEAEVEVAADLPHVHGDAGLLRQALTNLCMNARDALEQRSVGDASSVGRLRVTATAVELTRGEAMPSAQASPGGYVVISVEDNGLGMGEVTQERCFEPFYTTRGVGEGAGLGLAVVKGVIEQHRGWVSVDSELGRGTRFECWLPAAATPDPAARPTGVGPGARTVLLIDDEELVRGWARTVLEAHGYDVLEAGSGEEGLEAYARHGDVSLVLLDLSMPGLGGQQTLAQLLQRDPDACVVLWSGYAVDAAEVRATGARGFVRKPVKMHQLLEAIRKAGGRISPAID